MVCVCFVTCREKSKALKLERDKLEQLVMLMKASRAEAFAGPPNVCFPYFIKYCCLVGTYGYGPGAFAGPPNVRFPYFTKYCCLVGTYVFPLDQ